MVDRSHREATCKDVSKEHNRGIGREHASAFRVATVYAD